MKRRMTKKKRAYRRYCKLRYGVILTAYVYEYLVKIWLISVATGMVVINIPPEAKWLIAVTGITGYVLAKWYQLKNMKMRKNGR